MTRIINIIGAPGSGKTYLLNLLKKRCGNTFIYVDTDEISDKNALAYLEKHKIGNDIDDYFHWLKKK